MNLDTIYYWLFALAGLALVALIFFIIFMVKDGKLRKVLRLKTTAFWMDLMMLLGAGASAGVAVWLFIEIQKQISMMKY